MAKLIKSIGFGLFSLTIFNILTSCAGIPTTAQTEVDSKIIGYFLRPGSGPTIVFQSGLGDGKEVWGKVIELMPESVSIFAYDRPGYGDSPSVDESRNPCTISTELHELLQKVGLSPPYILVGHSLGGLDQYYYAKLFQDEIQGLVLLDPTHPNHWQTMQSDAAAQATIIKSLRYIAFSKVMRQEFDEQANCPNKPNLNTPLPVPTRLVFSGQSSLTEKGAFEKMNKALREEWVTLFSNVNYTEIADSGHYIQSDAPKIVVETILSVIDVDAIKVLGETSP